MSFQIHVGLRGLSEDGAKAVAASLSLDGNVHATYDPRVTMLGCPAVAISDSEGDTLANGMLSDNADWNADYWELRPEYLEPLNDLVTQSFVKSLEGITFRAGWIGDEVTKRIELSLAELGQFILENRLPTRTLILLEKGAAQGAREAFRGPPQLER